MKKFLKSFWIVIIAPLLVTIIGGLILTKIENVDFLSGVGEFIKLIFDFILNVLTLRISLWVIILVASILFFIFYIINKILVQIKKFEYGPKKLYEDYTEDYYNELKYRWNWYKGYDGMQIGDIYPICECGCSFSYDMFDMELECPDCKKKYKNNVDTASAERVFINRYNKKLKQHIKEYKNVK